MTTTDPDEATDEELRAYARSLFNPPVSDDTPEPEEKLEDGNRVPREGSIPAPPHDDGDLAFVRALFDPNSPLN